MTESDKPVFAGQAAVRGPWRRFVDGLSAYRPQLHAYCCRLTGNVWDGEDLMQDTLVRIFSLLGKIDAKIVNPRAYLIRTATNIWIDRMRRATRERAALAMEETEPQAVSPPDIIGGRNAAKSLLQSLHPQERAAFLMKDVFDLSLEETAAMLSTSVGAVKSALGRARGRLENSKPLAGLDAPPPELVEKFMAALRNRDLEALKAICSETATGELVGGAELDDFEKLGNFVNHAHMVMPRLGFGENPWWKIADYNGEAVVLGFRTLDGLEGLKEIHRIEVDDGKITRLRTYCFCPETLAVVAAALDIRALPRPVRSASVRDFVLAMIGLGKRPGIPA